MTWLARICGLLMAVLLGIGLWMSWTQDFDPQPGVQPGLGSPVLGIELVKSAEEFRRLIREPLGGHNRAVYRGQIREDWYFIPTYTALFVALGSLLAFRPAIGWRILALVVVAVMAGAAYCDSRENLGILVLVDEAPRLVTDAMAAEARSYARIKWGLIFAALTPIASVFVIRRQSGVIPWLASLLAAVLLFAGSIVGLTGALVFDPAISWGSILMGLGFGPAFFILFLAPETLASPARTAGG